MSASSDLSTITQLSLAHSGIEYIHNLHLCPNLRVLDLSFNRIQRIENLENNPGIQDLRLYNNQIESMRGLSTLKQLRSVVLTANNIEKIEGTKGLGNLHTLLLDSNQITQMSKSLTNLTSLTVLDLSSNSIQKMENLYNGRQLEILMLNNNGIRVVEGLRSCKGLQELHLSNNKIAKKLADLTQVPYLKILKLNSNRVADFSTFPVMKNLQELHLADNRISDLRNLAGKKKLFPKLEMMDLSENTVAHLSSLYLDKTLAEMPELMEVRLAGNPLIRKQPKYAKEVFQLLPQVDYVDNFEFDQQGNVFAAQASESQYQQPQPSQPQRQQQHQHQPSSRNQVTHAQDDQFQQFMQTVEDPLDDDAINDFKRQLQEMVSGDGQPTIQNPQQGSQSSQGSKISKSRPVSALHQQQKLEPVMGDNQLDNNVIDFREACESLRTKIAQELDALNNVETMSTLNVGDVLDPMGGDDDYLFEDVEDGEEYQYWRVSNCLRHHKNSQLTHLSLFDFRVSHLYVFVTITVVGPNNTTQQSTRCPVGSTMPSHLNTNRLTI
eukprot:TRINITY_DN875_c0_g1_i7.p1 TRINITY_DN875_c0_g1~~TRINITY_DN875_c0_g1_i7.p1  ORF type:complete len:634 (+),score=181.45 TRINITY_DN875_c0_g1_i7:250-1902(+)